MKCSKGGFTLADALALDLDELDEWCEAAADLEERIHKASKE